MTLRELLKESAKVLEEAGIENAAYDARMVIQEAFGLSPAEFLFFMDKSPEEIFSGRALRINKKIPFSSLIKAEEAVSGGIKKRAAHVPLQHILGYTWFMGLKFRTVPGALIPRQDTEVLAETVLKEEREKGIKLLDLGTGTGCLAISLKKLGGYDQVEACDVDEKALSMAHENAKLLGTAVNFYKSNLFKDAGGPYDVIVSNPPYIETAVIDTLSPEVRDHDPRAALDGGCDGLKFYRLIAKEAGTGGKENMALKEGGRIYLEVGAGQAEEVSGLFEDAGFCCVHTVRDLAGIERVVFGRKKTCRD